MQVYRFAYIQGVRISYNGLQIIPKLQSLEILNMLFTSRAKPQSFKEQITRLYKLRVVKRDKIVPAET